MYFQGKTGIIGPLSLTPRKLSSRDFEFQVGI